MIAALEAGGIPADRAYPGGPMPQLTKVGAAVGLQEMDMAENTMTVQVLILCPAVLGAAVCEDAAMEAARLVNTIGGKARISACELDGKTGVFQTAVRVTFSPEASVPDTVDLAIEELPVPYVVSFTAGREVSEAVPELYSAPWTFLMEEWIPAGATELKSFAMPFEMVLNGKETYSECVFTAQKRILQPDGIRQIREGTAASRTMAEE